MTFLNWSMLFALLAVAIPILIHLLNRSKPRVIAWGAMQFLRTSLTHRSRHILIEEVILLILRCLTVALIALAMARPFLPSRTAVPWLLVLPALLGAVVCAGGAAAMWAQAGLRRRLLRIMAVLLVIGIGVSLAEHWVQGRWWVGGNSGKDVAIILDGSMSMNVTVDGQTNFKRAVEEARLVIDAGRPGDAYSVILGGPVPHLLIRKPTSDRRELRRLLDSPDCRPAGGSMAVLESLNAAAAALAEGSSPAKTILLFTDAQAAGWDIPSEVRWRFVADSLKRFVVAPRVVCRKLPVPSTFRNASVAGLSFSRDVVGTDRPVMIDARVVNAGTAPVQPSAVEFFVDGNLVERSPMAKELLPNVVEVVHFEYRFDQPGRHVVKAQIVAEDDLRDDNALETVVDVLDHMPALIVDGAPSDRILQRASSYIRFALSPAGDETARRDIGAADPLRFLVEASVTNVTDLTGAEDLDAYRVIVLANVPRLPAAVTDRLTRFVKRGGGLLIAPGQRAEPDFYNTWQTAAGERISPAILKERLSPAESIHLATPTFTHPGLKLVAESQQSDAAAALVSSFWRLVPDGRDPDVRTGGLFDQGDAFLVERRLGRGYVIMTAFALDRRDSNLPSLKCFVPLIHELVYYLASPTLAAPNVKPGAELAVEFPAGTPLPAPGATNAAIAVDLPGGTRRLASLASDGQHVVARFGETREPGLYRFHVPPALAGLLKAGTNNVSVVPFTVSRPAEESALRTLSDADLNTVRGHIGMFVAATREEMLTVFAGDVPGQELWRVLAICALLMLLAETALARWIAVKRRFHSMDPVALRSPVENIQAVRQRMQGLVVRPAAGEPKS